MTKSSADKRQALLTKSKEELLDLLLDAQSSSRQSSENLARLEEAIDSINDAFVLFDEDGNLVFANARFKEYYAFNAPLLVPGTSFETLFRNEIKEGLHPGVTLEDEAFIQRRVSAFRKGRETATRSHAGNRWMLVTDRRTPSGAIVGLRTDITELKNSEEQATRAEAAARVAQQEAEVARETAERLARTDALTGLNNRRAFFELAGAVDGQARRYGHPYVFGMLDVDHFKSINDTWGHKTGDAVLQAIGERVHQSLRETDILGRVGGEEFAFLLPQTGLDDAKRLAERVRRSIGDVEIDVPTASIAVTVSIGLAERSEGMVALDVLANKADEALYRAKESGRNRVICHHP